MDIDGTRMTLQAKCTICGERRDHVCVEVRRNGDSISVDEIVTASTSLHLEQMDKNTFWFAINCGDKEWHFWLRSKSEITLTCTEEPT
jgi:hypothetical protein